MQRSKPYLFAAGALAGLVLYGAAGFAYFVWQELAAFDPILGRMSVLVAWCVVCGLASVRGKKK